MAAKWTEPKPSPWQIVRSHVVLWMGDDGHWGLQVLHERQDGQLTMPDGTPVSRRTTGMQARMLRNELEAANQVPAGDVAAVA